MKKIASLVAGLGILFAGSAAFADSHEGGANSLQDGMKSLSFTVPGGGNPTAGGAFGYWMVMNGDMNLGINVGLALDTAPDDAVWDILLAPAIRSYMRTDGNVTPYYYGQVNFRIASSGGDTSDPELGVAGGMGVEWFVTNVFSLAGQVGLGIDILRANDADPVALSTFTSALTAQMYFE